MSLESGRERESRATPALGLSHRGDGAASHSRTQTLKLPVAHPRGGGQEAASLGNSWLELGLRAKHSSGQFSSGGWVFHGAEEQRGSQSEARWWVHADGLFEDLGVFDLASSLVGAEVPKLGIQGGSGLNQEVIMKPGQQLGWLRGYLQTRERGAGKAGSA